MLVNFCFTLLSHRCLISKKTDKKTETIRRVDSIRKKETKKTRFNFKNTNVWKKNFALYKAAKN